MKRHSLFSRLLFLFCMTFYRTHHSMDYLKNAFSTIREKTKAGWEWIKEKTFKKSTVAETQPTDPIRHEAKVTAEMALPAASNKTPVIPIKPELTKDELASLDAKIAKIMKNIKKKERGRDKKKSKREKQKEIQELYTLYRQKQSITKGKGMPKNFNQFFQQQWRQESTAQPSKSERRERIKRYNNNTNRHINREQRDTNNNSFSEESFPIRKENYPISPQKSSLAKKNKQENEIIEERVNAILIPHASVITGPLTLNKTKVIPIKSNSNKNSGKKTPTQTPLNQSGPVSPITKP
jgi:hypothetical protein